MKHLLCACLFLFIAATNFASNFFPYEFKESKLENGLTVVLVKTPTPGQASLMTIVRSGSRDEYEEGHTGFAHLFEHMMFRGTKKRPGNAYYAATQAVGADTNASTSSDETQYHLNFAAEDLDFILSIEADRFQNLDYTQDEFKTETGAVLGEFLGSKSSPHHWLNEKLQKTAFEKHTYRHTTMGFEKDIRNMPSMYEYSLSFYERYYRPENTVLLILGDINLRESFELVKKHYSSWKSGYIAPKVPKEPRQRVTRRGHVDFPGRAIPTLTLAFKAPAFSPKDKTVVSCEVLGPLLFGRQSDVYQKLVVNEKLVLRLRQHFSLSRDPGLLKVTATLNDEKHAKRVEEALLKAIDRCAEKGPMGDDVKAIISHHKYDFLNEITNIKWALFEIGGFLSLGGNMSALENFFKTLNEIGPRDLRIAARKFLNTSQMTVVTLTGKEKTVEKSPITSPIIEMKVPRDPTVSMAHWFKVGSQNDPKGKEGLCHLTMRIILEGGTKTKSYQQMRKAYFPFAPYVDGRTDKEMTTFSVQLHKDNISPFYELWRESVFSPGFRKEDFDRVKEDTLQYLEKELRYGNDEELAKQTLHHFIFEDTFYGHPINGYINSLRSITLEDVKNFHSTHFTKERLVNAIGGSYPRTLLYELKKDVRALPQGQGSQPKAPQPKKCKGLEVYIVGKESTSTAISAAFPLDIVRGHKDFIPLLLANSWLGEHRNSFSHLFQVIRTKRGLNYGDYTYIEAFPDGAWHEFPPPNTGRRTQLFELWIRSVRNEQAVFALKAALREIDLLVSKGMTKEEFEKTRLFLSKYCNHYAKTTQQRLAYELDDQFYGLKESYLSTLSQKIKKLSIEEVNSAIKRHLQAKNMKIVLVTGAPSLLKKQLLSKERTVIHYRTSKSKEIHQEDELIGAYPLNVTSIKELTNDKLFLGN